MSGASNRLPVLAAEIKIAHAGVKSAAKVAAEHAIEAGQALIEAKALLKHGEWLPWLKEHLGFSDRTAQLYMKIVRLGFKSETVADLGLQAAANTFAVIHDHGYDPFYGSSEAKVREWLLFMLFLSRNNMHVEDAHRHVEWLLQGKDTFPLIDWLGAKGQAWRTRCGFPRPDIGSGFLRTWQAFRDDNIERPRADIEALLDAEVETQGWTPVTNKGRRGLKRIISAEA
jgi:hypothetical protein